MFNLYDAILPRRCLYCKDLIPSKIFCSFCHGLLRRVKSSGTEVIAAYAYAGMLRDLILTAKFRCDESITRSLTRHLITDLHTQPLGDWLREIPFSGITYVPSHWRRRLLRGHEVPGIIADSLAHELGLPLRHLITCVRFDSPLSAAQNAQERRERIIGRFHVRESSISDGTWILLVDDITTTGSTLHACANELQLRGFKVKCFALAKRLLSTTDEKN